MRTEFGIRMRLCSILNYPNEDENIAKAVAMLFVLYIISLVFAAGCLNRTFTRKSGGFSDCQAYYRTQGRPKTAEGIATRYFRRNCNDFLYSDENMDNLPDAPRYIHVRVDCKNRTADIIWMPRISNDMARKLYGFLLQARLTNRQNFDSTFMCYGIFMNETISSLLLSDSMSPPEFEFSCFESAPNAILEASIWSISSQDRNSCQSLSNCSFMVDQHSKANLEMTSIEEEKWCPEDCNFWKPDWRLMIVINESAPCPGLQLLLDNVSSSLASLHVFIVHNETGEVVSDKVLEHSTFESRENVNLATGLQKSGRYYAKLETVCKLQCLSTCPGITRFNSDYVSVSCDVPATPQPPTIHDPMFLILLCVAVVSAVFLTLCFCFKGPITKCLERWNPATNVSGVSSNSVHNPNSAIDSLLEDIVDN